MIALIDQMLQTASAQLAEAQPVLKFHKSSEDIRGKTIRFTGELQARVNGELITREIAQILARNAGLIVLNGVTKKLDILVVADPNTQSVKAKKAREYGTRILADAVFWRIIGVPVE